MKSHKILFAVLLVVASSVAAAEDRAGDKGGIVKPGQSLHDFRARGAGESSSAAEGALLPEGWPSDRVRLLGLTVATLACLATLLLVWRRRRFRAAARGGAARLEILDSIALSTRQWVCILRVDEKRVVVGVSGDTMTSLAVLDAAAPGGGSPRRPGGQALEIEGRRLAEPDRAGPGSPVDSSATFRGESTRENEGTFWFRPETEPSRDEGSSAAGDEVSWNSHLAPYRREVTRLRAMLQNWRQTTERGERAEQEKGKGKGE